jgi:hypothetical protein
MYASVDPLGGCMRGVCVCVYPAPVRHPSIILMSIFIVFVPLACVSTSLLASVLLSVQASVSRVELDSINESFEKTRVELRVRFPLLSPSLPPPSLPPPSPLPPTLSFVLIRATRAREAIERAVLSTRCHGHPTPCYCHPTPCHRHPTPERTPGGRPCVTATTRTFPRWRG